MRVIMLQRWASPHGSAEPGQEIELPAEIARPLVATGAARAVGEDRVRTRPAVPAANRAVRPRGGRTAASE